MFLADKNIGDLSNIYSNILELIAHFYKHSTLNNDGSIL